MARFIVRPVANHTESDHWSDVIVLSSSEHPLDVSAQPIWIIVASMPQIGANRGQQIKDILTTLYYESELKTAEILFKSLSTEITDEDGGSFVAVCLTLTHATFIGRGNFNADINRSGKQTSLLKGTETKWQAVEGLWIESDRWWLSAAAQSDATISPQSLSEGDLSAVAESLSLAITNQPQLPIAHALIEFDSSDPITTTTEIPAVPAFLTPPPDPKTISKRRVMAVGWLVLILLIISIMFGSRARNEKMTADKFSKLEQTVTSTMTAVNELKNSDQVKARETLLQLQEQVTQSKSQFVANKSWTDKWQALNTKVSTAYQDLAGVAAVKELPEWFALSVVKSGFIGDQVKLVGNNIVVFDKSSNTLVKIDITSKRAQVVAGGDTLAGSVSFAADGNRAVVITTAGVKEVSLLNQTVATLIEKDTSWQSLTQVGIFNGNIYMLDSIPGDLWRYPGLSSGVGPKQSWLGAGVTIAGQNVVDMAVDGDVWFLESSGGIKRYRRGVTVGFNLTGLDIPMSQAKAFSLNADQDSIAILDSSNSRIIRIDKSGNYQKQIRWSGLTSAQSIALSADSNTVYILKDGSLYTASF